MNLKTNEEDRQLSPSAGSSRPSGRRDKVLTDERKHHGNDETKLKKKAAAKDQLRLSDNQVPDVDSASYRRERRQMSHDVADPQNEELGEDEQENSIERDVENQDEELPIEAYLAGERKKKKNSEHQVYEGEILDGNKKEIFSKSCIIFGMWIVAAIVLAVTLSFTLTRPKDTDPVKANVESANAGVEITTEQPSASPSMSSLPSLEPTTSFSPTQSPTEIPTSFRLNLAMRDIEREFGNLTCCLDDSTSSQFQAATWLADEDSVIRFPVNQTDVQERVQFIFRYSFAVFYFSTNGHGWGDQCNFLSSGSICDWTCNVSEAIFEQSSSVGAVDKEDLGLNDISIADYLGIFQANQVTTKNGILCVKSYPWASSISDTFVLNLPYSLRFVFNNLTGTIPSEVIGLYAYDLQFNELGGTIPFESFDTYVEELNFEYNKLSGTMPSTIGRFTDLISFTVEHNLLTGTLPTELGVLRPPSPYLLQLHFNHNLFTGTLPTELGQLKKLYTLGLEDNAFAGTLPAELFQVGSRSIALSNNLLTGTIPENITENQDIVQLDLTGNGLTGPLPATIDQIKGLSGLYLDSNQLSNTIPDSLGNLTTLNALFLDRNIFTGQPMADDSWLWQLTNMNFLDLSSNRFSGTISEQISNLDNAVIINAQNNMFGGPIPTEIMDLGDLLTLRLKNNTFSGTFPDQSIGKHLEQLRRLWLQQNGLSGDISSQCDYAMEHLVGTGLFDYQADCLEIDCPCCTECCDNSGQCTLT